MEFEVHGNSGCALRMKRSEHGDSVVEKLSLKPDYDGRLMKQARKQREFANIEIPNVGVPRVLELNDGASPASFLMDYVSALNFVDFFDRTSVSRVRAFVGTICGFVDFTLERSVLRPIHSEILAKKSADVRSAVHRNSLVANDSEVMDVVERGLAMIPLMSNGVAIPIGMCHGDLTLSNMLFTGERIWLIDFLDSFVESPLIDIVKLRQDTHHRWSLLMYKGKVDSTRMEILLDYVDGLIVERYQKYEWFSNHYRLFCLMNFLRIVPYAQNQEVARYLAHVIASVLED